MSIHGKPAAERGEQQSAHTMQTSGQHGKQPSNIANETAESTAVTPQHFTKLPVTQYAHSFLRIEGSLSLGMEVPLMR